MTGSAQQIKNLFEPHGKKGLYITLNQGAARIGGPYLIPWGQLQFTSNGVVNKSQLELGFVERGGRVNQMRLYSGRNKMILPPAKLKRTLEIPNRSYIIIPARKFRITF